MCYRLFSQRTAVFSTLLQNSSNKITSLWNRPNCPLWFIMQSVFISPLHCFLLLRRSMIKFKNGEFWEAISSTDIGHIVRLRTRRKKFILRRQMSGEIYGRKVQRLYNKNLWTVNGNGRQWFIKEIYGRKRN